MRATKLVYIISLLKASSKSSDPSLRLDPSGRKIINLLCVRNEPNSRQLMTYSFLNSSDSNHSDERKYKKVLLDATTPPMAV